MLKLENSRRQESVSEYTRRKLDYDVIIVTENKDMYDEKFLKISYYDYLKMIKEDNIESKEFFIDDLKELLNLIGTKESVVQNRFILR